MRRAIVGILIGLMAFTAATAAGTSPDAVLQYTESVPLESPDFGKAFLEAVGVRVRMYVSADEPERIEDWYAQRGRVARTARIVETGAYVAFYERDSAPFGLVLIGKEFILGLEIPESARFLICTVEGERQNILAYLSGWGVEWYQGPPIQVAADALPEIRFEVAVPEEGVQVRIQEPLSEVEADALKEALQTYDAGIESASSVMAPGMVTINLVPVADAEAFAKRIACCEVLSVEGNVINLLVNDRRDVAEARKRAWALYMEGKYKEALPFAKTAQERSEAVWGPNDPRGVRSMAILAAVHLALGELDKAEFFARRALAIDEKVFGPEDILVARDLNNLAEVHRAQDRYTDAEPLYQRALAINRRHHGPRNSHVATDLTNMGGLYLQLGEEEKAELAYSEALSIWDTVPESPNKGTALQGMAKLRRDQGRNEEALEYLRQAIAVWEETLGPEHPWVELARENYAKLLRESGRKTEAAEVQTEAAASNP